MQNLKMIIEYKNMQALIGFCALTKSYYGSVDGADFLISFQASSKKEIYAAMYLAVDQFLQLGSFFLNFS